MPSLLCPRPLSKDPLPPTVAEEGPSEVREAWPVVAPGASSLHAATLLLQSSAQPSPRGRLSWQKVVAFSERSGPTEWQHLLTPDGRQPAARDPCVRILCARGGPQTGCRVGAEGLEPCSDWGAPTLRGSGCLGGETGLCRARTKARCRRGPPPAAGGFPGHHRPELQARLAGLEQGLSVP